MEELNAALETKCSSYLSHHVRGKDASVGELLEQDRNMLYPLPGYPFDPSKRASGRVDRYSTVRFDTNSYSVPVCYCGREVSVKASPERVSIYMDGACIAQHSRCLEKNRSVYALEHYLPLLEKKGRAIFYARPVQDSLPGYFLKWLQAQDLTPKELVQILRRCQEETCESIMSESPVHTVPAQIEDTVPVQAVDLQVYDTFLQGKVGAAV